MNSYDVIIIGAGPGGVSASLYAKRANLNVIILYTGSSSLEGAHKIENYYGFPDGISGKDLYEAGIKQAENIGVDVKKVEVLGIRQDEEKFVVKTTEDTFEGKTIILASGNQKVKPKIKGIEEYEGRGVSYCAICDAFFFRKRNVAVIGNGKFALSEAEELAHVVGHVTLLTDGLEAPETEYDINTNKISEITGDGRVEKVIFENGEELPVDGIFVALGEAGARDFANNIGIIQDGENIRVNSEMQTNIPGVYACGNITGGLLQVCTAVYEGAKAGLSATTYVRSLNK